jgi:hypothetical protein
MTTQLALPSLSAFHDESGATCGGSVSPQEREKESRHLADACRYRGFYPYFNLGICSISKRAFPYVSNHGLKTIFQLFFRRFCNYYLFAASR